MKARTFTLRLDRDTGRLDDDEMVEFLEEHDATALSEHLVQIDGEPALVVVVRWRPAGRGGVARVEEAGRRSRVSAEDPRTALDPAEQAFIDAPPRYQLLHAMRAATTGGENLIADAGAALA